MAPFLLSRGSLCDRTVLVKRTVIPGKRLGRGRFFGLGSFLETLKWVLISGLPDEDTGPPPSPLLSSGEGTCATVSICPSSPLSTCALEADPPDHSSRLPALCLPSWQLNSEAPEEKQEGGEEGGQVSVPGLPVFRDASGHRPGGVAHSTAPSLSLLSAPISLSLQPRSGTLSVGGPPWVLWLPLTPPGLWTQLYSNRSL